MKVSLRMISALLAVIFFGVLVQANDDLSDLRRPSSGFHEFMWQCTAHNEHDQGHQRLYRGQPDYDRHEAQHSAMEECEYYEGHRCELAGCRRIRY